MLNTDILDVLFTTQDRYHDLLWSLKGENEVKRTLPALQPVARIVMDGGNVFDARPLAFVFPLPDGTLIRLELNDNNTYDYGSATAIPGTHPAAKAYAQNLGHSIKIVRADEGDPGLRADPTDVEKLKERLESDRQRSRQELEQERHLKL
jgi:hypothetical protein